MRERGEKRRLSVFLATVPCDSEPESVMLVISLLCLFTILLESGAAEKLDGKRPRVDLNIGHEPAEIAEKESTHPIATSEDIKEINKKLDNIYTTLKSQDLDGLKKAVEVLAILGGPVASAFSVVLAFMPEDVSFHKFPESAFSNLGSCNGCIIRDDHEVGRWI